MNPALSSAPDHDFQTKPRASLGRIALGWAQGALELTGAAAAYRRIAHVRGATILMYHSVPAGTAARFIDPANAVAPEDFESQVAMLARRRRVISMTELVEGLDRGVTEPAGTVAITFDDGYLDNLTVAAPILARYGLPATLYLATGYVTRREPQWIDQVYVAFRYRTRHSLTLEDGLQRSVTSAREALTSYRDVCRRLLPAPPEERRLLLDSISEQLAPSLTPPELTLGWEDVRRLTEQYPTFEIGVHTAEHVDLTNATIGEAELQVRASMDHVEQEIGQRPIHFSFPYGRHDGALRALVRSLGLRSALGAGLTALITARTDRFALTRLEAPGWRAALAYYTSGAYPGLSRLVLRRA